MPDHMHLVVAGLDESSDQLQFSRFFRKLLNQRLKPHRRQRQPHDHVLRKEERDRNAFASICNYVTENPLRKHFVKRREDYPFTDCMIPGYPEIDPFDANYWDLYWRIYNKLVC